MSEVTSIPQVGDFIVTWNGGWWRVCGPLTRVTEQRVWFARWGREGYEARDGLRFWGAQKNAQDLASVLQGINANHRKQVAALAEQQRAQIDRATAKAMEKQ